MNPEKNAAKYEEICNEKLPLIKKVIKVFKDIKTAAAKFSKMKRFNSVNKYGSNDIFGEIALTLS